MRLVRAYAMPHNFVKDKKMEDGMLSSQSTLQPAQQPAPSVPLSCFIPSVMFMGPITWRQVLFSVKPPTALLRAPWSAGLGSVSALTEGSLALLESGKARQEL